MAENSNDQSYLKPNRLSDLIRIISVLAADKEWDFRSVDGLNTSLNGGPQSAADWFTLAKEHPEFIRFNTKDSSVILLLRFLSRNESSEYQPLSIDQTQKLIEQVIALHDRAIARSQRDSYKMPLWSSFVTALASLIVAGASIISNSSSVNALETKLDKAILMIDELEKEMRVKEDTLQNH